MTRWRPSLAAKTVTLQVAGLVTVVAVVGVTRSVAIRQQLYREVEASARNLIQMLQETLAERPELLRPGALAPVVARFTYKLPGVARVSLVSPTFEILADSRLQVGQPADQTALLPLLREGGEGRFYYESQGQHYLRASRALRGRYDAARRSDIVGAVAIDMRLAPTDAAIRRELGREMLVVAGLLIPISFGLIGVVRRSFVRPLEALADAGVRFARGEIPAPLTFGDGDELEAVARSFNEMVAARSSALKERERQLAAAQAIAHIGSWEWHIPTNRLTWSDELCRMYGQAPGSPASYEAFVRLVHPEDRDRVERIIAHGLAERRTVEYDWRLVLPSGDVRHVHGINVVILDDAGTAIGLAGTSLDITDRKRAEENQQTLLRELQIAVAEVKTLQGWLRICANCKRVLNDQGRWEQVESYMHTHSKVDFSHGICPDCAKAWSAAEPPR